ncbi:hypothetical protein [Streptococcus dentiloxodontae]
MAEQDVTSLKVTTNVRYDNFGEPLYEVSFEHNSVKYYYAIDSVGNIYDVKTDGDYTKG